jgi:RNA polymerase sigma-70 factor (ECF subfamily)
MQADEQFQELIRRVRAGDGPATAQLVRQYEPEIRRTVRVRLRLNSRLRRLFDSMDVCQSVLASFFARAALGQFDIDRPDQVLRLLVAMAHNKLAEQVRKHHAQRRDNRRRQDLEPAALAAVADQALTPSRIVADEELLRAVRRLLSDEERRIADYRAQGTGWAEIARELGGTAKARRMQFARALDRVVQQLGLESEAS